MSDAERLLSELVASGLFTEAEARAIVARKGAREFGLAAVQAIRDLSPWPVARVEIRTEAWNVTWSDGQLAVAPVRPRSTTEGRSASQSQAKATAVAGIPAEIWKQACADLGVKYFGASAASRSSRVRQRAIELAKAKGIVA